MNGNAAALVVLEKDGTQLAKLFIEIKPSRIGLFD
jgi:hypothetical protein